MYPFSTALRDRLMKVRGITTIKNLTAKDIVDLFTCGDGLLFEGRHPRDKPSPDEYIDRFRSKQAEGKVGKLAPPAWKVHHFPDFLISGQRCATIEYMCRNDRDEAIGYWGRYFNNPFPSVKDFRDRLLVSIADEILRPNS